jgi:cell division protein FtsW
MARKVAVDKSLFLAGIGLTLFGLVMIYSASSVIALERYGSAHHFLLRQVAAAIIGLMGMYIAMRIDYRKLLTPPIAYAAVGLSTLLLGAVLLMPAINNVHRWIRIGPIQIQPSEIAKLALLIYLAYRLGQRENRINDTVGTLLPISLVVGQLAFLVYLGPDLGTAGLCVALALILLFLAGMRWRYLVVMCGACVGALGLLILQAPYRIKRIVAFLDPGQDPLGAGFQVRQSLVAVASGGVHGTSLGESRQKMFFLPEPHTDFIFSVIGEELGLIGATAVIAVFGVLFWRGMVAAFSAPDRGGYYLGIGITLCLVLQAMLNIGVALGLCPTKGVPLPFLSYGGSSLVVSLVSLGVLLNISQHSS